MQRHDIATEGVAPSWGIVAVFVDPSQKMSDDMAPHYANSICIASWIDLFYEDKLDM